MSPERDDCVAVSIICLTYNHENYIAQCLQGFVEQKTDFVFEVLVHDDCSTDRTTEIVRQYAEKYPHIIKPIYENENQFSKRIPITKELVIPRAKGKYLAWCEGDDYWCDVNKLQKQYAFLEGNPDYSMCVHRSKFRYLQYNYDRLVPSFAQDREWTLEDIISNGGGVFATNSLMMKKDVYLRKPELFNARGFGDFQLFAYGAIEGKCYCFADIMSVYNHGTPNSFTERNRIDNSLKIRTTQEFIALLERMNEYTQYRHNAVIQEKVVSMKCDLYIMTRQTDNLRHEPYRSIWFKHAVKYGLRAFKERNPKIVRAIYTLMGRIKRTKG